MKLVSFKKMDKQKKLIIGSIIGIVLIIGSIVFIRSYALYKEEKEFNVLKGTIPDFGYDIKMLSVVVDGEKSKTIPERGLYKANVECSEGSTGEWDYNAWNLIINHAESNTKCNITFTSNLSEEEYDKYIEAGKALRRNTYRGKDITEYHNDGSLYEMISSGRFDDIYVGDYIIANNITWLVADIDNYLYTGTVSSGTTSGDLKQHHLTIIPSSSLIGISVNDTDTTEGGYYNSRMKQETLPNILENYVKPAFESHILTYYTALSSTVNMEAQSSAGAGWTGSSNGWSWVESQIDLMSEINVYGTNVWSSSGFDTGIDNRQYAIFRLKPEFINTAKNGKKIHYWLKNVVSKNRFAWAGPAGDSTSSGTSGAWGVRPRFLIG